MNCADLTNAQIVGVVLKIGNEYTVLKEEEADIDVQQLLSFFVDESAEEVYRYDPSP